MKTVCRTNVRKALRKCWDTNNYEDVNEEWCVSINGRRVELWNHKLDTTLYTGYIYGCYSMTEFINYAANRILEEYEQLEEWERSFAAWEEHDKAVHPWDYLDDSAEYNAYQNAYDYFVYGEAFQSWVNRGHDCGIDPERRRYIWALAFWSCADGEAPADPLGEYERLVRDAA